MDSVASNTSSNEEATHVSPQYDSSEEWEIGLGNLIIDLDADLEKDRQDVSGAAGGGGNSNSAAGNGSTLADSSPLRIGKMKIKRKVSTNTPTTPSKSGSESNSPRGGGSGKDSLLSAEENSGSGHKSPIPQQVERIVMVVKDEKNEKVAKCSVRSSSSSSSSNVSGNMPGGAKPDSSSTHVSGGSGGSKHLDKVLISTNPKGSSGDNTFGKYNGGNSTTTDDNKRDLSVDNTICRNNKSSMDHSKPQLVIKKENTGGGKSKKEEKDGKGDAPITGKKGGEGSKRHGGKKRGEKASSNSIAVGTSDVGTLTEPENLGPCEPGTSVNLEGIVWHETDQGVLVVNVTWRNKTYVGTLMDCTRHDWAPPRFCDSPTSDVENRTTKTCGRPKRGRAAANNNNNANNNDMSNFTETRSSVHSKLRNANALKGRKGNSANGSRTPPAPEKPEKGKRKHRAAAETGASSGDDSKSAKRLKVSTKQKEGASSAAIPGEVIPEPGPSGLIECPEPNCSKKYKHVNGYRYHRQHAHQEDKPEDDEEEDSEEDSETKSSSDEGSIASSEIDNHVTNVRNDRTDGAAGAPTTETKAADPTPVDKSQLYSTAAAAAAANAAAAAAAAAAEEAAAKALKKSDKTSPKLFAKSKDNSAMPGKSKGDLQDKLSGGKSKKAQNSTTLDKDLSVFDFNSAMDSDSLAAGGSAEKHVSVIRPTADASVSSPSKLSEPVIPMAQGKLQDVIHTMPLPGSDHMEDMQRSSRKSDKDKSKSGDRKKGKHDKVPNSSKVKPNRPVIASPIPPQLVAVPANVATPKALVPATTTQAPKAALAVNSAAKPSQPKPGAPGGEAVSSPSVTNPKEKKSKSKKKSKDKDKEREKSSNCTKDKESKDASVVNNKQQTVQQQQIPPVKLSVAPTLPPSVAKSQTQSPAGTLNSALTETNILHQALTASGIGPEDAERNSPSVTANPAAGEVATAKVVDPSQQMASKDPSQATKDARALFPNRPPVQHGATMPEMPKLIPTSSVVNPAGRTSVNPAAQPPTQLPAHQVKPIQQQQGVPDDNLKVDTSGVPLPSQVKATILEDGESNAASEDSRARSPAYSDISDANEDSEVAVKSLNDRDPFTFQDASRNQAKVVPSRDEHNIHSKSLYNPMLEVGSREHLPENMPPKTQQDPLRTVPPLVQPVKAADSVGTNKEGRDQTEGPDPKKPRKDSGSPRLPGVGEAGYRPPPPAGSQAYPGQYPYMSGFVMDQQYHMHLLNTDSHYRQQHEQFRQEQKQLQEKERLERERHERGSKDKAPRSKTPTEENRDRTVPMIKTEPITPPKRSVLGDKGQDRSAAERPPTGDNLLKRKQLDFHKPDTENAPRSESSSESRSTPQQQDDPARSTKAFIHQQHQEEMRQYYIYQQKVQEQQKYEEEQRRKLEESRLSAENSSQKEKDSVREEAGERHRTTRSPSPPQSANPPKSRSPALSSVEERKLRGSPSTSSPSPHSRDPKAAMSSSSSSRKVLDYPSYLQPTPYGPMPVHQTPYGPIPIDPNHPAYHHAVNPIMYPAYLAHDMRFAGPPPMVGSPWKSAEEKAHYEHERSRAISPHQGSTSRGSSPSDPPPKALDLLQQHASRYYQKHDRARSPGNDKSRTSSPQRRSASPRKSPEASSTARERAEAAHRNEQIQQAMVHQHMHTHQHTHHVGMGYPAVLPPYDPYVIASQQAAAAAAGVGPPYAVRRENLPP